MQFLSLRPRNHSKTQSLWLRSLMAAMLVPAMFAPAMFEASCKSATNPNNGNGGGNGGGGTGGGNGGGGTGGGATVKVKVLAINDFHGNIQPPSGGSGKIKKPDPSADGGSVSVDAGGAAYLATHVATLRAQNPNTVVVSAGDLVGASPLASAFFHDEPSIEAMNLIGLDLHAVGNHEFDKGSSQLLRLQYGGCSPTGCVNGMFFPGANFEFLASNVIVDTKTNKTLFPGYSIREFDGVKVGFIGMTLEGTPAIVTPSGVAGLTFADEVITVNNLVPELQQKGVGTIVVLLHEGGYPGSAGFYDECPDVNGAIVDIAMNLSPAVDVIVSAHTHQAYNCTMSGKLVTSAASFGRLVTDIDLEISNVTGRVVNKSAHNVIVTRDVAPDMAVDNLVTDFVNLAAPLANAQIGTITGDLTTAEACNGLTALGMVVADTQLAATQGAMFGNAVVAFMNPGGVRADLVFKASGTEPMDGIVTYGEGFTVQPFGNSLIVMTLTGEQIRQTLEQQWKTSPPKFLQPSQGFSYTFDANAPVNSKVAPESIKLTINGQSVTVDPKQSYRVTVNSFLATGGDGFVVFNAGTERLGGDLDVDALKDYFALNAPVSAPLFNRISVVNSPVPCP